MCTAKARAEEAVRRMRARFGDTGLTKRGMSPAGPRYSRPVARGNASTLGFLRVLRGVDLGRPGGQPVAVVSRAP